MSELGRTRPGTPLDRAWRVAFKIGFPLARLWWKMRGRQHEGALVAIYVDHALLLVRPSYRHAWTFPGGGIERGETPEAAARREVTEELGFPPIELRSAGSACGIWDGRKDKVHFFELRLDRLPRLQLDNREIVAAQLVSPLELREMALTGPVRAYLNERLLPALHS